MDEDFQRKEGCSRRGFLKTAAAIGTVLAIGPVIDQAIAFGGESVYA